MADEQPGTSSLGGVYWGGAFIVFVLVFLGGWLYQIVSHGFLYGLFFGWVPSLFLAAITALLWPLVVVVLIWLFSR